MKVFKPTILLALALMGVIVMMILPVPAIVLDIGLAASFGLAILIFTLTLFIERPLDFSSFPTILLASLMLRLSLNVSSTKLIIGQGHTGTAAAGGVIQGFADFVMGGSLLLGLVTFGVLMIVNFIVITKGAARMAEVGARFALDAMPGKQLAIDSDMSAGAIGHEEAKSRRETEQQETTFFGSLDGASKFVKGDAVAGLLITGLNLVVGLMMGVLVHGMPAGLAFETYAILTVGDGLVTQIPAVIISIAAALLLAKGGARGAMDMAVFGQLGRHPTALIAVAILMGLLGLVPGLPFLPFVAGAAILGIAGYRAMKSEKLREAEEARSMEAPADIREPSIGDMLDLDDIHVEFASDLVDMVLDPATGLDARISNMRSHVASNFGLLLPEIRLTDNTALPSGTYNVRIHGVIQATDTLRPSHLLALVGDAVGLLPPGEDVSEPVYGAPARWIGDQDQEEAAFAGVTIVTPAEVLATHLLEVVKQNFPRLMTLKALRRTLSELTNLSDPARSEANRKLIDELVPDKVPVDLLLAVLRLLLEERVSIRNLPMILEAIAEARTVAGTPEAVCEHVRQRLGFQLVAALRRPDGTVPLLQLAPEWEDRFRACQVNARQGTHEIALPPDEFDRLSTSLAERLAQAARDGINAGIVAPLQRRRFITSVLAARGLTAPVLSYEEVGMDARPSMIGQIPA
ncbi:flagellar biosynthesis protein FlhA [Roseicyclus sp. F158]|uniref:Flagellar biosynthesis protein FlhA n=2 Tax=Tropicimonas omnivorans TaxID=3075590 RepID=A0ABU3DD86_9RHOB|nr:flagellar biosynthesis protein FlhA [Roseicyclus sp. F158]MDT0681681.1 flagellar biosynthesis protein FlhA [Roseicyclus sp. F158]